MPNFVPFTWPRYDNRKKAAPKAAQAAQAAKDDDWLSDVSGFSDRPGLTHAPPITRPAPAAHPCTRCERFAYREPTLCYWCKREEAGLPHGAACEGCGEACERCLPDAGGPTVAELHPHPCPSCGGGGDTPGGVCFTCRDYRRRHRGE
jgi:hypothetical protein